MKASRFLCYVLCALLCSAAPLYAELVQVHVSLENYYADGASVDVSLDNFGNTDFTIGNLSGPILWEVLEKAWWDTTTEQTIISYTVFNDAYPSNITGFAVPANTPATSVSAPVGWTGAQVLGQIAWVTVGTGIPMFESLDTMIVRYPGLLPISFHPSAAALLADGTVLSNENWVVSSVPEPMTLALLGLGALALIRRRKTA